MSTDKVDVMEDEGETGLPASIEAVWGRRRRPSKGPKPGLSLDRIVEAAVRVAASEGLSAVSMGRVAAELDAAAMSLYRYIGAKDELLCLMVDTALGQPPVRGEPEEGWRAGLSRWAWRYHDILRRHPWIVRIPISGPSVTPNLTAWLEAGLTVLRSTGLPEAEKLSVVLLLSGFVRNDATLMADIAASATAAGAPTREVMAPWGLLLRRLADPERFPALHAALASDAFDHDDGPDAEFVFGLERILDGVGALVGRSSKTQSGRKAAHPGRAAPSG